MHLKYLYIIVLLSTFIQCKITYPENLPYSFSENSPLDTLAYYHNLDACHTVSALDYPMQAARFTIDRPSLIKKIILHLDGAGTGKFTTHIYGHESGTNYPALQKDLVKPIIKKKHKKGAQTIEIKLKQAILVSNDQFYIVLDSFQGDFGLKQDPSFYQEYCCSDNGGNYYPSILKATDSLLWGENCYLTMDVFIEKAPLEPAIFEDITENVGISLKHSNEHIIWEDLDGDNWVDLLVNGSIYKNNQGQFENITASIIKTIPRRLRGGTIIDIENDGDKDILLFGTYKSLLYVQEKGFTFSKKDINIPALPSMHGFSMADINGDKLLDLVLVQLWEPYPVPHPNYLFLNDGQYNFIDISTRLYPKHDGTDNFPDEFTCIGEADSTYFINNNKNRRSRAAQFTDMDLDGDVDLYITNYFTETDEFYENDGKGFFKKIVAPKPFQQSDTTDNHGTGIDWYDFDNDGDFDLLLPQLAHPRNIIPYDHRGTTIFRNDNGQFTDLSPFHGIEYEETHAGATFGDVNNDGLVDIITTIYYGCRFVDLYLQQSNHRFQLSTYRSGLSKITTGNDACFVDFNNDGLLDLAMGSNDKFRLFKNVYKSPNNWLKLQLLSTSINRFGVGAIVKVYLDNNEILTQEVNVGRGQRMQKPTTLHYGIGNKAEVKRVEVHWQKGNVEVYTHFNKNATYILKEKGGKDRVQK